MTEGESEAGPRPRFGRKTIAIALGLYAVAVAAVTFPMVVRAASELPGDF